jgi:hypothetical protein
MLLELMEERRHLAAAYVAGRILREPPVVGLPKMDLDLAALQDEVACVGVVAGEAEMPDIEVSRLGDVERRQDRNAVGAVIVHASNPVSETGWAIGG